jgi:predicted AlkP superfamily phosphohydrolase/phosphomutase
MTGKNPGKHGIFSFAFRQAGTYERRIIDPQTLTCKTLWRILSDAGKRVGVVNVPMCDAQNINGFIIPGFVSRSEGIPYPDSLKEKIKRKFGIDRLIGDIEIPVLEKALRDPDLFFEQANQVTEETAEVCLYLLQEEKWDFFMSVFMGLDRIQHFFWRNIDPTHPRFEENTASRLIKNFYMKADNIVGHFLKFVDENTTLMVLSDHGFCPVYKEVIVNNYLEEESFLVANAGKVDLERSKAVAYGYGDVWLNVRGREPRGFIDPKSDYESVRTEISDKLRNIIIDGKKPIKDVKRREELYWGENVKCAPDLTIMFNVGWQGARRPEITERNKDKRYVNDNPRWSGGHDGTHDPLDVPGVIGMLGAGVQGGQKSELCVSLWDAAPTILKLMGVPIPDDMDGKPFLRT